MGRLVSDPELKHTTNGTAVTTFRIAVDRSYVVQGKERQADFFDVVAWRSTAEFVCRNFSKGSLIAVDGYLQSRQYQTKDGQNRTAIEVIADELSFTGERSQGTSRERTGNEVGHEKGRLNSQYETAVNEPEMTHSGASFDPRFSQGQLDDYRPY